MDNEERKSSEKRSGESRCEAACCGQTGSAEASADCCGDLGGPIDCTAMMERCPKGCKWFPLVPIIIGVLLVVLGYYLEASVIRTLWMVLAGLVVFMGALGFLMMRAMKRAWRG